MKEANCLERGMRPTLNEPDDLRRSAEPKWIAGLNSAVRCVSDSAMRRFGKIDLHPFIEIKSWC